MELKTNVTAEEGSQQIIITRKFDLAVDLRYWLLATNHFSAFTLIMPRFILNIPSRFPKFL